jgi:hypothetical protein
MERCSTKVSIQLAPFAIDVVEGDVEFDVVPEKWALYACSTSDEPKWLRIGWAYHSEGSSRSSGKVQEREVDLDERRYLFPRQQHVLANGWR